MKKKKNRGLVVFVINGKKKLEGWSSLLSMKKKEKKRN